MVEESNLNKHQATLVTLRIEGDSDVREVSTLHRALYSSHQIIPSRGIRVERVWWPEVSDTHFDHAAYGGGWGRNSTFPAPRDEI